LSWLIRIEKEFKTRCFARKLSNGKKNENQDTQLRNNPYTPVQMRGRRAADSTVVQLVVERSDFVLGDHRVGQGSVLRRGSEGTTCVNISRSLFEMNNRNVQRKKESKKEGWTNGVQNINIVNIYHNTENK